MKKLLLFLALIPGIGMAQTGVTHVGMKLDDSIIADSNAPCNGCPVSPNYKIKYSLVEAFKEYKKECYNDSIAGRRINIPEYTVYNLSTGKCDTMPSYRHTTYSHKQPDFNDFMEWYIKKQK